MIVLTQVYKAAVSGNNYRMCVCAAELLVWFRLFELAVVRGCGWHETIIASWFSEMCDQFLTSCSNMYICLCGSTQARHFVCSA